MPSSLNGHHKFPTGSADLQKGKPAITVAIFISYRKYLVAAGSLPALLFVLFFLADRQWPLPTLQTRHQQEGAIIIADQAGVPLRVFGDHNGVIRYPVTLATVSPHYLTALLGYEDRWFYQHPGINPIALLRAFWQNQSAGRIISGGSTLSMQTARLLAPSQRGYGGKLWQIFHTFQLEYHYSKQEILTLYLQLAPFGGILEGVKAASITYLGKPPHTLSRGEAALLAILPQAPSRYRPDRHPERAQRARDKLIDRLVQHNTWSAKVGKRAKLETVMARQRVLPQAAPLLARRLRPDAQPGIPLLTTIDSDLQFSLRDYVRDYLQDLPQGVSTGVLVVENENLAVRAYIGSANFLDPDRFGHVDMVQAVRSPGSALKPFLYGLAVDTGLIHVNSLLSDVPRDFGHYRPENFSRGFQGPVTMQAALQRSLNIPAIQVMEALGAVNFTSRLAQAGVRLQLGGGQHATKKPSAAIILGGVGITLENLVTAYTSLARGGRCAPLRYLKKELNQPLAEKRLLSAGAAWIIRDILAHNPRPNRYRTSYVNPRPLAWKTGTSYGFRDTWAIGTTPRYTLGVWVGRPDATPLAGHTGSLTAAPLLFGISDTLAATNQSFSPPPITVSEAETCWPLGIHKTRLADPTLCHLRHKTQLLNNNAPPTLPSLDTRDWLVNPLQLKVNPETGAWIPIHCNATPTRRQYLARWPKTLTPWLPESFRQAAQMPPVDPRCQPADQPAGGAIKISGIPDRSHFIFGQQQKKPRIALSALGGQGNRYWFINGQFVGQAQTGQPFYYEFTASGEYQLGVIDAQGNQDNLSITLQ